ncbi:J domain-containing protein [Desulfonatronovibrio magnus]|uniref:J domain-containing protein n=1 Tax=Desulfonatronovibrio magnus TaxID=698827 RepID=UPI0005EB8B26|nr:DnaJ domain-containing protein [Desulfonatronovibrio magnus]
MFEKDYSALRVSRDDGPEKVRKAFVKLSMRYHPEHFPEKYKRIKSAYDRLQMDWDSLFPMISELSRATLDNNLKVKLMQDYSESISSQADGYSVDLDIYSLEPVLAVSKYRKKITEILDEVSSQEIEFKTEDI